jgi:2,4-dienoyl-CoA reductase-like NADH-dependent reductase (Old Yellow Enzyme family)
MSSGPCSRIIATGAFEPEGAEAIVEKGDADRVAFGRHFISNAAPPGGWRSDFRSRPMNVRPASSLAVLPSSST